MSLMLQMPKFVKNLYHEFAANKHSLCFFINIDKTCPITPFQLIPRRVDVQYGRVEELRCSTNCVISTESLRLGVVRDSLFFLSWVITIESSDRVLRKTVWTRWRRLPPGSANPKMMMVGHVLPRGSL